MRFFSDGAWSMVRFCSYYALAALNLFYIGGSLLEIIRYGQCLSVSGIDNRVHLCKADSYRSDISASFFGQRRSPLNVSNGTLETLLLISINFMFAGPLSLVVVWLVDHREKPNGFTRLVQWFSLCQVLMDVGFALCTVSLSAGYYEYAVALELGVTNSKSSLKPFVKGLYWVGAWLLSLGDVSSVIFITVMSFIFYRLAAASKPIDVMVYLPRGLAVALVTGVVVAILEVTVCTQPTYYSACPIVRVRGVISLLCVLVNCSLSFAVSRILKRMPEGLRKEAVKGLSSRILLYTGWVTISRLSFIYLTLETGTLNLNFADAAHLKFTNFMSTLTYLMWLPSGTGFAIIYLYTHPEEARYAWDFVCMRKNVCWLPTDLHDIYYSMMESVCCCLPSRCTGLYSVTEDGEGHHRHALGLSKSSMSYGDDVADSPSPPPAPAPTLTTQWVEHVEDPKADLRFSSIGGNRNGNNAIGAGAGAGAEGNPTRNKIGGVVASTAASPLYDGGRDGEGEGEGDGDFRNTAASAGLARSTGVSRQHLSVASGLRNTDGGMSISDLTTATGLSFASEVSSGGGLRGTTASAAAAAAGGVDGSGKRISARRRGRGAGDAFVIMKPQSEDDQLDAWAEGIQADSMRDTGGSGLGGGGYVSGSSSRANSAGSVGTGAQQQQLKKSTLSAHDGSGDIL